MKPSEFAANTKFLIEPTLGNPLTREITENLANLTQEIQNREGNLTRKFNFLKQLINEICSEFIRKDLSKVDLETGYFDKSLTKLLSKYLSDPEAIESIKATVREFIKTNFESSVYPFLLVDDELKDAIYDELKSYDPVKSLDYDSFFFDYVPFLEAYSEIIHEAYDKNTREIKAKLEGWLDETIYPAQSVITEQLATINHHKDALIYDLFHEISEFRASLTHLKKEFYDAQLSLLPIPLNIGEKRRYEREAQQYAEDQLLEVEDNWMNAYMDRWFNPMRKVWKDFIDLTEVKVKARSYAAHNEKVDSDLETIKEQKKYFDLWTATPRTLKEEELQHFAQLLSNYMNLAREKNLQKLLIPAYELVLNPENKDFYMAAFLFNEFFRILPSQLADECIYSKEPITPQRVIQLGLDKWQASDTTINCCFQFISNQKSLENTEKYLVANDSKELAKNLKQGLKKDNQKNAQIKALTEGPGANLMEPAKVKLLVDTVRKENEKVFNVILNRCNLPTLRTALKQVRGVDGNSRLIAPIVNRIYALKRAANTMKLFQAPTAMESPIQKLPEHKSLRVGFKS